jgi:hypothetical protein
MAKRGTLTRRDDMSYIHNSNPIFRTVAASLLYGALRLPFSSSLPLVQLLRTLCRIGQPRYLRLRDGSGATKLRNLRAQGATGHLAAPPFWLAAGGLICLGSPPRL